jgi:non-ribosomal peptide synthetase component E (peptide arylation enzyme)
VVCKSDLEVEGLKQHLKKYLPDYMIPNHVEKIDEMPLTPSGKADRKALPQPLFT